MARLTTTKYYELKINLYSLANKLINELDFETTKKIKDFIKLINYGSHLFCSSIRRKSVCFNFAFAGELGSKHISISSCICLLSFKTFG